jgi:hypothetical protein
MLNALNSQKYFPQAGKQTSFFLSRKGTEKVFQKYPLRDLCDLSEQSERARVSFLSRRDAEFTKFFRKDPLRDLCDLSELSERARVFYISRRGAKNTEEQGA